MGTLHPRVLTPPLRDQTSQSTVNTKSVFEVYFLVLNLYLRGHSEMASSSMAGQAGCLLFGMLLLAFYGSLVLGSDPDIVTDFGINVTSGADLHFTGFRDLPEQPTGQVHITFAFDTEFPGVIGMGIAPALLKFGTDSVNSFHTHPRGAEIFVILDGELDAGIVDTANNLYTATLKKGDVFVFPMGLMHYQINRSKTKTATVLAAFASQNAGRVSLPPNMFNTEPRIETDIIMKSLFLDKKTVERLKASDFPTFA
ncbi:hypothetical protein AXG93_3255s1020 [Marchantia polymorpha subsp. ruderalis]|uniref:Germin-like protein n=3 Tax=Marchantia polymorpha TaxID=3197 RepID=A0A176VRJ1_MARPO|nr:hypothetical protein AXG93_3255s1020 [Marchantia polymorpha subsp. ruderalis]